MLPNVFSRALRCKALSWACKPYLSHRTPFFWDTGLASEPDLFSTLVFAIKLEHEQPCRCPCQPQRGNGHLGSQACVPRVMRYDLDYTPCRSKA